MGKAFKLQNGQLLLSTEAPGGVYNAAQLKKIAALCDSSGAIAKATEDQRLALLVTPEKAAKIAAELKAVGLGVRHYQDGLHQPINCLGELCPEHLQDAMGAGIDIAAELAPITLDTPLKIGINGCSRCCLATHTLDISIVGDSNGYRLSLGGKNSQIPEMATFVAEGVPADQLAKLVAKVVSIYKQMAQPGESLQEVIERQGSREYIAALAPYSQDAHQEEPAGEITASPDETKIDELRADLGDGGPAIDDSLADTELTAEPTVEGIDDDLTIDDHSLDLTDVGEIAATPAVDDLDFEEETKAKAAPATDDSFEVEALPDVETAVPAETSIEGETFELEPLGDAGIEELEETSLESASLETNDLKDDDADAGEPDPVPSKVAAYKIAEAMEEAPIDDVEAGDLQMDPAEVGDLEAVELEVDEAAFDAPEAATVAATGTELEDAGDLLLDSNVLEDLPNDSLVDGDVALAEAENVSAEDLTLDPPSPDPELMDDLSIGAETVAEDLGELTFEESNLPAAGDGVDDDFALGTEPFPEEVNLDAANLGVEDPELAEETLLVNESPANVPKSNPPVPSAPVPNAMPKPTVAAASPPALVAKPPLMAVPPAPASNQLGPDDDEQMIDELSAAEVGEDEADAFEKSINDQIAEEGTFEELEDQNSSERLETLKLVTAEAEHPEPPASSRERAIAIASPINVPAAAPGFEFTGLELRTDGRISLQFASGAAMDIDPRALATNGRRELRLGGKLIVLVPSQGGVQVEVDGVALFLPQKAAA